MEFPGSDLGSRCVRNTHTLTCPTPPRMMAADSPDRESVSRAAPCPKAWLQVLLADSSGILVDLTSSWRAPESARSHSQTIVCAKDVRNVQNAYRWTDQGIRPFKHARCDNASRLVRFPANRTGSYHVRSSPSVRRLGETCPRSALGTRNRNGHAKSYRAAWSQVCLGLRGAPKTLKLPCRCKAAPTRWVEFKKCATHSRESVRSHFSLEPCTRVVPGSRQTNELKTQTRATAQGPPHCGQEKRRETEAPVRKGARAQLRDNAEQALLSINVPAPSVCPKHSNFLMLTNRIVIPTVHMKPFSTKEHNEKKARGQGTQTIDLEVRF